VTAASTQVPAAPVRAYVQGLLDEGMTQAAIRKAAGLPKSYLSELLHGRFEPGRPARLTLSADRAERLLAIRVEVSPTPPEPKPAACEASETFQPVGHRVGRCGACGQFAQVQARGGKTYLVSHPHPAAGTQSPDVPPAFAEHPECGTLRGHNRHMRAKTPACELCKAAKGGYEQGRGSALSAIHRATQGAVPWSLIGECEAAARAVVFRRAYPQLRELSVRVLRAIEAARESSTELDALLTDARAVAA